MTSSIVELPYISRDRAYDFNYQETRRLKEEREVLPGDSFQVICDYRSKDVRQQMTVVSLFLYTYLALITFFQQFTKMQKLFCWLHLNR